MRSLWALDHELLKASKAMRRRLGVTGPQRLVVRIVGRYPGISAGELASILHLHPSTLTGVLKRLGERGLLARRTDALDGRRALFTLAAGGRALERRKRGTIEGKVRGVLQALDERDIATAETVLRAVARSLHAGRTDGG